jgi:hypothetical protein
MRAWMVVALLPLLAGCTDSDWNRVLGFGADQAARPAPRAVAAAAPVPASRAATEPQAAPAPPPAQPDPFCIGIARQDATTNGFDTATQQKTAVRSYQQCVQIFAN